MRWNVVINEKAGLPRDASLATELKSRLARSAIDVEFDCVPPEKIESALRRALARAPDAVLVGGGDGTVRTAAALVAAAGSTLGILPLGTLNHFAKDIGMPVELPAAIDSLIAAEIRWVDVGEVNGEIFLNNASIGAYADAVRQRETLRRHHPQGKMLAMARASFAAFRKLRILRLSRQMPEGGSRMIRTPLMVVANNRYSGRIFGGSFRPRLDEGKLWVYTAHVHRHLSALRLAFQSIVRPMDEADALEGEAVTELVLEGVEDFFPIALDGEIIPLESPLHFRIRPKALRVLAPPPGESRP